MSFVRHQFDMLWMQVQPTIRSIITITLPSSLASSARSYMSSMVAAVMFR